ncbi:MAG: hypothetical protein QMB25_07010 [Pseudomonadales bacterium]|jgi:uncharacterized membrane protein YdbT with pleckstrin-like domain
MSKYIREDETMNIDQFLHKLDSLGGDLDQWPDAEEKTQANELMRSSDEARQAFVSAQRMETLFAQDMHKAPAHLLNAIYEITQQTNPVFVSDKGSRQFSLWMPRDLWPTAIAAVIPLIISFAVGLGFGLQPTATNSNSPEYADINSWVYADSLAQSSIEISAFFPAAEEGLDNDAT